MRHDRDSRMVFALAALLLCAGSLAPAVAAANNDTVRSLSLSGSPFAEDLAPLPQQVQVRLTLSRQARVTVRILRLNGTKVRTFAKQLMLPAGDYSWSWDGLNGAGAMVPDGIYQVRVKASNGRGVAVESRHVRKGLPRIFPANPGLSWLPWTPATAGVSRERYAMAGWRRTSTSISASTCAHCSRRQECR